MGCSTSAAAERAQTSATETKSLLRQSTSTDIVVSECPVLDFHTKYVLGEKINQGRYSLVYDVAKINETEVRNVAVKIVNMGAALRPTDSSMKHREKVELETYVWKAVRSHPNCAKLYEMMYDQHFCYMVTIKCTCGLLEYMQSMAELNEQSLAKIFAQMVSGINHMHSFKVVHCDVKPDNFLVGGDDGHTIKLTDFALARVIPLSGKLQGSVGTPSFMCPEMLEVQEFDEKADVWSLGVSMFGLLCGEFPYTPRTWSRKKIFEAIMAVDTLDCERSWLSDCAIASLRMLLNRNPDFRVSAARALEMPYLVVLTSNHQLDERVTDMDSLADAIVGKDHSPCLHRVLSSAVERGVFGGQEFSNKSFEEEYLTVAQFVHHGASMPPSPTSAKSVDLKDFPEDVGASTISTSYAESVLSTLSSHTEEDTTAWV